MKNPEPIRDEEKLGKLLHEWKAESPLPSRFQEGVWRRIEASSVSRSGTSSVWNVFAHWVGTLLPRPAMATAYVAVLIFVGATVGWTQAHQTNAHVKGELGDRYVRALNPYQAPRQ